MRALLLCLAVSVLGCGGGGGSDDGSIQIKEAQMSCGGTGGAKFDVTGPVANACNGKQSCICDQGCWSGGNPVPAMCSLSFELQYTSNGKTHIHLSGGFKEGAVFEITADGKVNEKAVGGGDAG